MEPASAPSTSGFAAISTGRKRPRVCFPFVGDSVGGSHISALLLIRGLERTRYEPVIVLHQEGPLAEHLRGLDRPFELLPLSVYAGAAPNAIAIAAGMLRNVPRLAGFMRRHGIGIVHGNDFRMNLTWSAGAKLTGRPFVWHQRAMPYSSSSRWRAISLLADHVIHISEAVARAMPAPGRTPTSIIPNPVALPQETLSREAAKAAIARELGFDPSARVIGLVGRLVRLKRADIFIVASARLARRLSGDSLAFVLLGQDEEGLVSELHDLALSEGIEKQVYFAGFRTPIERWIRGMDVLMATSEWEGFGRTLVEAMAVGTPVVASRVAGHIEIIDHERTGLLVAPGDPDAFATAAHRILTEPALAVTLEEAGRACALERYAVERHVQRITPIYDSLLSRGDVNHRTYSQAKS